MKKELDEALCKEFPTLFRNRYGDMRTTAMCWGFDCGDGWYDLIKEACRKIVEACPEATMTQVKEKYGDLRLYHAGNDQSYKVEDWACRESTKICEVCGKLGKTLTTSGDDYGWYSTLCPEHAEKLGYIQWIKDEENDEEEV